MGELLNLWAANYDGDMSHLLTYMGINDDLYKDGNQFISTTSTKFHLHAIITGGD